MVKSVTAGVVGTVQHVQRENMTRKTREIKDKAMEAILDGRIKMTVKEHKIFGHCVTCHTENTGHNPHLRSGDCRKLLKADLLAIPDDDDDLEEPSFHSTSSGWRQDNGVWKTKVSKVSVSNKQVLVSEGKESSTLEVWPQQHVSEGKESSTLEVLGVEDYTVEMPKDRGVQRMPNSTTASGDNIISGIFAKLDEIQKQLAESDDKLNASNEQVQKLSEKVEYLENVIRIKVWSRILQLRFRKIQAWTL